MIIKRLRIVAVMLFCVTLFTIAQDNVFEVEFGFQTIDLDGNEYMYNSQINQDDGLIIRGLTFSTTDLEDTNKLMDRFRLDITGFGGSPHGSLRFKANHAEWYNLTFTYSRFEHFNAIPGFADPITPDNLTPGQHTVDRTRDVVDFELELLPAKRFKPVIGLHWNSYDGPGRTTYHFGHDEFQLDSNLDETEREIRLGLRYEGDKFHGEIMQGWRNFSGTEDRRVVPGANDGNNGRPFLGEDLTLDDFTGRLDTDADTPVTTAVGRYAINENVHILGNFIYADAESEISDDETFSGNLADLRVSRFFGGGTASVRSQSENPSWRGNLRLEANLPADFALSLGYTDAHRELDGNALMSFLYTDSAVFGGGDASTYQQFINAETHMERDESVIEGKLTAEGFGPFQCWVDFAQRTEDVFVDQDLAEIVLAEGQEGDFNREIERLGVGAAYRKGGNSVSAEWFTEDADNAVVRTDFLDREVLSLKARTKLGKRVGFTGRARWIDAENSTQGIGLESDQFTMGLDLDVKAHKYWDFRLSYGIFDLDSQVNYVDTWFIPAVSIHTEDGDSLEFWSRFTYGRLGFDCGARRYDSEGAITFTLDRYDVRASVKITDHLHGVVEAEHYEYEEERLPLADYESDRIALLIRWRR